MIQPIAQHDDERRCPGQSKENDRSAVNDAQFIHTIEKNREEYQNGGGCEGQKIAMNCGSAIPRYQDEEHEGCGETAKETPTPKCILRQYIDYGQYERRDRRQDVYRDRR